MKKELGARARWEADSKAGPDARLRTHHSHPLLLFRNRVMKTVKLACLVLLGALSSTSDAQVRDVRGYEINDSGYLGRPAGTQQDIYWLDSSRIIFIGAKPGDYIEPNPGLRFPNYGLYVWDTNLKAVTLHHEGSLYSNLCVYRGYVRLEFDRSGSRYVFEGWFGKETLRRLDKEAIKERTRHERVVNRYTCREYKRAELPALGYRVEPLLEGEFTSREREPGPREVVHWKYWPHNGPPVLLDMTPEPIGIVGVNGVRSTFQRLAR